MNQAGFKKTISIFILGLMMLFLSSAVWSNNLEIHYINVRQGQSILIIGPDNPRTTILLDGGNSGKGTGEVVPYLQSQGIYTSTALNYIIATHLHADHYKGLTETMNAGYDALNVYDNGSDESGPSIDAFYAAANNTTAGGVSTMQLGDVINMGGATVTCVAVDGSVIGVGAITGGQDDENDRSIALLIQYGHFDYLVTGDMGGGDDDKSCTGRSTNQVNIETPLVQAIMPGGANPLLSSDGVEVVHVGHHGSESSTNSDYMNLLTPAVGCISVGAGQGGNWHHPRKDVVENVLSAQASCITAPPALVLQTEEGSPTGSNTSYDGYCVGDIVITTNGATYTVNASGAVSQGPDERSAAGLPMTFDVDGNGNGVSIVFSEIYYDAQGIDADEEWIELYNNSGVTVDIGGWTITDNNGSGSGYTIPQGHSIAAGSYFTIAADSSGFTSLYGCDANLYGNIPALTNTGDTLILKNDSGAEKDAVAWEGGAGAGIPAGWGSLSLPKASTGYSIVRQPVTADSDTYTDWTSNQVPDPHCNGNGNGIPHIELSRTNFYFGAANGVATGAQSFLVANSGDGTLNWQVTDDADWLQCSPGNGTNTGVVTVSVDSSGLAPGNYYGTISVEATNAAVSPQTVMVVLSVYRYNDYPFGAFELPAEGSTVRSSIAVTGWVLDDIEVESVKLYLQEGAKQYYIGDGLMVENARPDIEQLYHGYPMNYKAGWGYMMLTNFLPNNGNGTYVLVVKARDTHGQETILGTKTIKCDNNNAVKPFGAIDTPGQGAIASGSNFTNWGWALTPQPNKIPTDGSTIFVYVDGVNIGSPNYNLYRSDVAGLFADYANSNGAGGYFTLDTTAYENGTHTINWTAADNAGNIDGIGSRFFTVQNLDGGSEREASVKAYDEKPTAYKINDYEKIPVDYLTPIKVKRGYDPKIKPYTLSHGHGMVYVQIKALERVEIHLGKNAGSYNGYLKVGGEFRKLPAGSTLDRNKGVFYWQPGPGFIGEYQFVFIKNQSRRATKKNITVNIVPMSPDFEGQF